jgi:hypothetical protein
MEETEYEEIYEKIKEEIRDSYIFSVENYTVRNKYKDRLTQYFFYNSVFTPIKKTVNAIKESGEKLEDKKVFLHFLRMYRFFDAIDDKKEFLKTITKAVEEEKNTNVDTPYSLEGILRELEFIFGYFALIDKVIDKKEFNRIFTEFLLCDKETYRKFDLRKAIIKKNGSLLKFMYEFPKAYFLLKTDEERKNLIKQIFGYDTLSKNEFELIFESFDSFIRKVDENPITVEGKEFAKLESPKTKDASDLKIFYEDFKDFIRKRSFSQEQIKELLTGDEGFWKVNEFISEYVAEGEEKDIKNVYKALMISAPVYVKKMSGVGTVDLDEFLKLSDITKTDEELKEFLKVLFSSPSARTDAYFESGFTEELFLFHLDDIIVSFISEKTDIKNPKEFLEKHRTTVLNAYIYKYLKERLNSFIFYMYVPSLIKTPKKHTLESLKNFINTYYFKEKSFDFLYNKNNKRISDLYFFLQANAAQKILYMKAVYDREGFYKKIYSSFKSVYANSSYLTKFYDTKESLLAQIAFFAYKTGKDAEFEFDEIIKDAQELDFPEREDKEMFVNYLKFYDALNLLINDKFNKKNFEKRIDELEHFIKERLEKGEGFAYFKSAVATLITRMLFKSPDFSVHSDNIEKSVIANMVRKTRTRLSRVAVNLSKVKDRDKAFFDVLKESLNPIAFEENFNYSYGNISIYKQILKITDEILKDNKLEYPGFFAYLKTSFFSSMYSMEEDNNPHKFVHLVKSANINFFTEFEKKVLEVLERLSFNEYVPFTFSDFLTQMNIHDATADSFSYINGWENLKNMFKRDIVNYKNFPKFFALNLRNLYFHFNEEEIKKIVKEQPPYGVFANYHKYVKEDFERVFGISPVTVFEQRKKFENIMLSESLKVLKKHAKTEISKRDILEAFENAKALKTKKENAVITGPLKTDYSEGAEKALKNAKSIAVTLFGNFVSNLKNDKNPKKDLKKSDIKTI